MQPAVTSTDLTLPEPRRGKVRDTYRLPNPNGPDRLLIIATDRLSAFDIVLPTPVPGKGVLLTSLSTFWLRFIETRGLARTHLRSVDAADVPERAFKGTTSRDDLAGRVTIGTRCRVLPVECVVRGYLEGSGWRDYQSTGRVCGHTLPAGLRRCERLPEPLFTPATKADAGEHDENIGFDDAARTLGRDTAERLREMSLAIYSQAAAYALERGIIIADTKFEFGLEIDDDNAVISDEPILIDEALTPDSSRFWPSDLYQPGKPQPSYDKQFVREHLETLVGHGRWNKAAPGPELPPGVVKGTLDRYEQAIRLLTA